MLDAGYEQEGCFVQGSNGSLFLCSLRTEIVIGVKDSGNYKFIFVIGYIRVELFDWQSLQEYD